MEGSFSWSGVQVLLRGEVQVLVERFALPAFLREVARCNQRVVYNLLYRAAAASLQELARDPRHVNGQVGLIGVLHTWGRNLCYQPHDHFLVPAGGVAIEGKQWLPTRHNFLVPIKPLSRLFRAKFQAGLRKSTAHERSGLSPTHVNSLPRMARNDR